MTKLAIALPGLGPSQLAYHVIAGGNALVAGRADADIVALYETLQKPCLTPTFAAMQVAEGWGFDGPVVATTVSTAEKVLGFPSCPRKLFLVWDLEWLRLKQKAYRALRAVYAHPDLTLLARCKDHARVISECWNREPLVVEDFDLGRIIEVATG